MESNLEALLGLWTGIALFVAIVVYGVYKLISPKRATLVPTLTQNTKARARGNQSKYLYWAAAVLIVVVWLGWYYHGDISSSPACVNPQALKPLLLAPIIGVLSYYLSDNKRYRNMWFALQVTLLAAVLIYLLLPAGGMQELAASLQQGELAIWLKQGVSAQQILFGLALLMVFAFFSGKWLEAIVMVIVAAVMWQNLESILLWFGF